MNWREELKECIRHPWMFIVMLAAVLLVLWCLYFLGGVAGWILRLLGAVP